MTFEHWWASLTNAEKKILTENYARYIWNTAQAAVKDQPKESENKFEDGQQPRLL